MQVLVVDDTAVFRRIVTETLSGIPGVEVAGTASNGKLAMARLRTQRLDLLTLDIEMPEMNGIEVLEAMSAAGLQVPVIVLSSLTLRGGAMTMRALELGAFDFITKPETGSPADNIVQLRQRITPMIRALERRQEIRSILRGPRQAPAAAPPPLTPATVPVVGPPTERHQRTIQRNAMPLVLIGVSTGGPTALARVLPALPGKLGAPVFVVQHMPAMFTRSLADSLGAKSALRVKEAEDGEIAVADCVYIAPGGRHLKLARGNDGAIAMQITDDPKENNCRPAVDYLFRSAALQFPGRSIAVILTGMGGDGTAGLKALKRTGCFSIAQDEASCVVFGMPREAIQAGTIDVVLPIDGIAASIVRGIKEAGA